MWGGFGGGAGLGGGAGEEQVIGDVLVLVAALLGQVVGPAEQIEEGADELLLGGGLVQGVEGCGVLEAGAGLGAEGVEVGGLGEGFLPGGGAADAFFEKVVGEELAGHWSWDVGGGLRFRRSVSAGRLLCQFKGVGAHKGRPYGLATELVKSWPGSG